MRDDVSTFGTHSYYEQMDDLAKDFPYLDKHYMDRVSVRSAAAVVDCNLTQKGITYHV